MKDFQKIWEKLTFDFLENKKYFYYNGIKKYLTGFYRDTMSVFLVSLFFKQKNYNNFNTFFDFLNFFVFKPELNKQLYHFLRSHFYKIEQLVGYFSLKEDLIEDIQILGDVHGVYTTKVLLIDKTKNKKFAIGNDHISDNHIIRLFDLLVNKKVKFSPIYHKAKGFRYRYFLPYSNDFHSRKEISCFYKEFGMKSAFLLALRTIDLHYENFLISENSPYFFDYECIFAPFITDFSYSISISGIIDDTLTGESFGPLFGGRNIRKSFLIPFIENYGETPSIIWTLPSKYKKKHIPKSTNVLLNPYLFYKEFLSGFVIMQKKILQNKKKLINAIHQTTTYNRILFRPTRVYFALIKEMLMKFSILEDIDVDQFLSQKLNILPLFTQIIDKKLLIEEEIKWLKYGIIPYFYSEIHDKKVFNSENKFICLLEKSCEKVFIEHMYDLKSFYLKAKEDINYFIKTNVSYK